MNMNIIKYNLRNKYYSIYDTYKYIFKFNLQKLLFSYFFKKIGILNY